MVRRAWWVVVPLLLAGVTGCGTVAAPLATGQAASINLSLTTVPTIRSVTISPGRASFTDCGYGDPALNTKSTASKLGFPNGVCWIGSINKGEFPITITNTGIASYIYVSGSSANPADLGTGWNLCTRRGFARCNGARRRPGTDQYQVDNFSTFGTLTTGLTGEPRCDQRFGPEGSCWAVEGMWQKEGIELIGPTTSSDTSTKWTMTITWTPVPSQG
jgi:hypothetical protein